MEMGCGRSGRDEGRRRERREREGGREGEGESIRFDVLGDKLIMKGKEGGFHKVSVPHIGVHRSRFPGLGPLSFSKILSVGQGEVGSYGAPVRMWKKEDQPMQARKEGGG